MPTLTKAASPAAGDKKSRAAAQRSRPSGDALALLDSAVSKAKDRSTPVRREFIRREGRLKSPLASLLAGGRGEAVRLKLFLALLFMSGKAPHDTRIPARAWAQLLDLDDPEGLGTRRIRDALDSLSRLDLIDVVPQPGHAPVVTLRDDGGRGVAYKRPTTGDRWVPIPSVFWRNGWICVLSGAAIATLLVLLDWRKAMGDADRPLWISPRMMADEYGLSDETRLKGVRELGSYGVVAVLRRNVETDPFRKKRIRHHYRLNLGRLDKKP